MRDESDRKSKLRLVIEPRTSKIRPRRDDGRARWCTPRSRRATRSNLTWLGLDGLPETKGIVEVLREWGEWRVDTVRRRTQFRLDRVRGAPARSCMGRLLAFVKIDEIIKLIRASEDQAEAQAESAEKFKFTERQAQDIVNLRLGQLTKLDGVKLNDERKALGSRAKRAEGDPRRRKGAEEAGGQASSNDDAKKFGDERRTLIKPPSARRSSAPWSRSRSP